MSAKDELHHIVDQLPEERSDEALVYLRQLLRDGGRNKGRDRGYPAALAQPNVMSGQEFFTQGRVDVFTLAEQQGITPIANFEQLLGDFWPEDEEEDFDAVLREWRSEG